MWKISVEVVQDINLFPVWENLDKAYQRQKSYAENIAGVLAIVKVEGKIESLDKKSKQQN